MGTRYVWEQNSVGWGEDKTSGTYADIYVGSSSSSNRLAKIGYNVEPVSGNEQYFRFVGSTGYLAEGYYTGSEAKVAETVNGTSFLVYYDSGGKSGFWYARNYNGSSFRLVLLSGQDSDAEPVGQQFYRVKAIKIKGDFLKNLSNSSSSHYPTNGVSGNYWYTYVGSDNIDPISISYPTEEISPGTAITVKISPSTSKKYGGTVSYLYQYSVDGGSTWNNSGGSTTSTSKSITIPTNAKQFRVRVRAEDNLGFTSTTYVTGSNFETQSLQLWVGVSGKARKGTDMWVGVNGKARKVVEAYVGVNGKARRFF